jgi:hypothetical protein
MPRNPLPSQPSHSRHLTAPAHWYVRVVIVSLGVMSATAAEPPPFESISSVHTTATSAAETAGPRAGVDRSLSDTGIKVEAEAGSGAKEISDDEAASQDEPSPCPSSFRDQVEWLSKVRTGLEYSVCIAAYRVDSLFGNRDEAELDEARAVYGRLRLGTYWDGYDGFDPELRLRASYPLPSVKQRARAIIGRGTDEELIEGAPREIDSGGLFSDEEDVNWLVGLGYNRIRSRNSRLDFGAGLKLESRDYGWRGLEFERHAVPAARASEGRCLSCPGTRCD